MSISIWWIIFIIFNHVQSVAGCDAHSLVVTSTIARESKDRPAFQQLIKFDGVTVSHCDSLTEKVPPELRPSLQDKQMSLASCEQAHVVMLESLYELSYITNSTVDLIQRRHGCSHSDNGTVSGFETWALNGADLVTFDPQSLKWTSLSQAARTVESRWNSRENRNLAFSNFLNIYCPQLIKSIKLKSVDQKTDLHISVQVLPDVSKLRCQVTSTDQSVRSLALVGDGASVASQVTVVGPLPSGDGSVILRLTAEIPSGQHQYTYGCRVQTEKHNFSAFWQPSDPHPTDGRSTPTSSEFHQSTLRMIICALALIVVIIVVSAVVQIMFKCGKANPTATPMVPAHRTEEFRKLITSEIPLSLRSVMISFLDPPDSTQQRQAVEQWHELQSLNEDPYYGKQTRV